MKDILKKPISRNKFNRFIVAIAAVVFSAGMVYITTQSFASSIMEVTPSSAPAFNWHKVSKPTGGQVLQVSLKLDYRSGPGEPNISLQKVRKLSAGVPTKPRPNQKKSPYEIQILDASGKVLSSQAYVLPSKLSQEVPDAGKPLSGMIQEQTANDSVTLSIPASAASLVVKVNGKVVNNQSLSSISTESSTTNYYSVMGDDATPRSTNAVNITFISDRYPVDGGFDAFHSDVDLLAHRLLDFEPFHARKGDIRYNFVDNSQSLGCQLTDTVGAAGILICDDQVAVNAVAAAGAPTDYVVVITNLPSGRDTAGGVAVINNVPGFENVFVHEFGHLFGKLFDEYVYASSQVGPIDGTLHNLNSSVLGTKVGNCYSGIPPSPEWNNLVAVSDYSLGCAYANWYRSADQSMMRFNQPAFNAVSQQMLTSAINQYATPPAPGAAPNINSVGIGDGEVLAGQVSIKTIDTNVSDQEGIAREELWLDNNLLRTIYDQPFQFKLPERTYPDGPHVLKFRVINGTGVSTEKDVNVIFSNFSISTTTSLNITKPTPTVLPTTISGVYRIQFVANTPNPGLLNSTIQVNDLLLDIIYPNTTGQYSYDWDTRNFANGTYIIKIHSFGKTGGSASAQVSVIVNNPPRPIPVPIVKITSPTKGKKVGGSFTLKYTVKSSLKIKKIYIYVDGKLIKTLDGSVRSLVIKTSKLKKGNHVIRVSAKDSLGHVGISSKLRIVK